MISTSCLIAAGINIFGTDKNSGIFKVFEYKL